MPKSRSRVDERLSAARVAIDNALADREILTALSTAGYGEAELWEGQALYLEAKAQTSQLEPESDEQEETPVDAARKALRDAWAEAERAYVRTRRVARLAFRGDPKSYTALKLGEARKASLAGWLEQATALYNDLRENPKRASTMANLGHGEERLEQEAAQVLAVAEAQAAYEQEAQKAAEMPNVVIVDSLLVELDVWMASFEATAREALKEHPQWLEKLGFGAAPS